MNTIIGFSFFLINHVSVTIFRVYLRHEKLKNYYIVNPELRTYMKGFERRVFRPSTFLFAGVVTLMELLIIASVS